MNHSSSIRTCFLCDDAITGDNDSKEHIIPQSIGGRKKVKGFICRSCNSQAGDEWDVKLANALHDLGLIFRIKRERSDLPAKEVELVGGSKVLLQVDGDMTLTKPLYEETRVGKQVTIRIQARSKAEAKQRLMEAVKKYPGKFDIDEWLDGVEIQKTYPTEPFSFSIDLQDEDHGHSSLKSAVALLCKSGVNPCDADVAKEYLKHGGAFCFAYYSERDLIVNRPEGVPLHCVSVKGIPESKLLVGYVEFYGIYRIVLCLSRSYEGDYFQETYAIDPREGAEINLDVALGFSERELELIIQSECFDPESLVKNMEGVFHAAVKRAQLGTRKTVPDDAVQQAMNKMGIQEIESITEDHFQEFIGHVFNGIEPYLLHQINRSNRTRENIE